MGILEDNYYLHGLYGSTNDKPALIIKRGKYTIQYEVYYKERGTISSLKVFTDEEDACRYF